MPSSNLQPLRKDNKSRDQIILSLARLAFWVFVFFASRTLLLITGVTLMIPITLFLLSFTGSSDADVWQILFWIFYWPWALTGRSSFDENDLGLLFGSWATVVVIVSLIVQRLFPSFKIKLRAVLLAITIVYIVTGIDIIPQIVNDGIDGIVLFILMYLVCIGSVSLSWSLNFVSTLVRHSPPARN